MMKIKGHEIDNEIRECHLVEKDETLTVEEIEQGSGTGLRRFKLYDEKGNSCGIFYEDHLPSRVLE